MPAKRAASAASKKEVKSVSKKQKLVIPAIDEELSDSGSESETDPSEGSEKQSNSKPETKKPSSSKTPAILCRLHGLPCIVKVSKSSNNSDREFFGCPRDLDAGGCGFAAWTDDFAKYLKNYKWIHEKAVKDDKGVGKPINKDLEKIMTKLDGIENLLTEFLHPEEDIPDH